MNRPRHRLLLLLFHAVALGVAGLSAAEKAASPAAPRCVLYVFAHQDDELFVLGQMRRDVLAGNEVHTLWTTDGARIGKPAARERESRAVMALIGVPAANLHFLQFPDHASFRHVSALAELVAAVVRSHPFAEVISPAYEGGNIDHDVAALMGAYAARLAGPAAVHREFPLYNRFQRRAHYGEFLPNADSPVVFAPLDPASQELVLQAMKLYRSQRVLLTVLSIVGRKKVMLARGEPFRVAPRYDYRRPPVPETCGYEVSGLHRAKFQDWLIGTEPFLRANLSLFFAEDHSVPPAKQS
ncbi:MAG: PIG-L family deacetylase [Opitutaceae bacterium]